MYRPVPSRVDLPAMERQLLDFWDTEDIFHKSLAATADGPRWVFYEGPPTANGTPGTHHVEARVFKDVFPRYKTMKGYHVPRKAGWDCHGLPVELAVEKELGFSGKGDIEAFGVAEFNAKCRDSVLRHVDEFSVMTRRMGYWVDMDQAYWTMDRDYVQSVWWSLAQIFKKGLLVQDHRVTPYCPRCGTGLSDHELAQGYEDIVDASVYVRFPITGGELAERFPGLSLLVWTTTPWTLISNTAAAVHAEVEYSVAKTAAGELLLIAEALRESVLGEGSERLASVIGRDLEGTTYRRPFDWVEFPETDRPIHTVLLADFVTTEDGTGIVHEAPAFGAEDLQLCRSYGLPVVNPVRADGTFEDWLPEVGGVFFKTADTRLVEIMEERGQLFRHLPYEHPYPHCWRCHTALIYYAQPSWYIRTTAIKDALLRENGNTNWYPETIKWGRYGDWLNNNVDWALSRNRYWGTPLPIWRCESNHLTVVESLAELAELAGDPAVAESDPHRPYVDDISFSCPQCQQTANRVPEVIDCWYDSGSMPFAQWGYPHQPGIKFDEVYPADFICEAIDQTRGWFYTLMAIGTLVFDQSSYRNVVCLGHILDEDGRKMSKHLGNVLEPVPLMDEHGADAVRWFMLAGGSPWQGRRVGHATIAEVVRKTLLTYWATVSFQALYARAAGWSYTDVPPVNERPLLDRWLISESNLLSREVDRALEQFDTQRAGRLIADFIDNLSNWYVRRSRRRFWDGDTAALASLHEALRTLTLVMSPFTPFITEQVWQDLFAVSDREPRSVHLASWPAADADLIDERLGKHMELVRRLVELGRGARAEAKVKTRQPLGRALVAASEWEQLSPELRSQVAEELNVQSVASLSTVDGDLVEIHIKANFRALGKRYGQQTQVVATAVAGCDAKLVAAQLRESGHAHLIVDGIGSVELTSEDVVITETPREGWAVMSDAGASVALDLTVTPELKLLGLAREAVRLIQEARKNAGLDIGDRISVHWSASDEETAAALRTHSSVVAGEVLATSFSEEVDPLEFKVEENEIGLALSFQRA